MMMMKMMMKVMMRMIKLVMRMMNLINPILQSPDVTDNRIQDPNAPGPGYYNPTKVEEAPTGSHIQNAPPFLTSAARENKKTTQWFNRNFVSQYCPRPFVVLFSPQSMPPLVVLYSLLSIPPLVVLYSLLSLLRNPIRQSVGRLTYPLISLFIAEFRSGF